MDMDASEAEEVNRSPSGQRGALLTTPSHLWAIRGQGQTSCAPLGGRRGPGSRKPAPGRHVELVRLCAPRMEARGWKGRRAEVIT